MPILQKALPVQPRSLMLALPQEQEQEPPLARSRLVELQAWPRQEPLVQGLPMPMRLLERRPVLPAEPLAPQPLVLRWGTHP